MAIPDYNLINQLNSMGGTNRAYWDALNNKIGYYTPETGTMGTEGMEYAKRTGDMVNLVGGGQIDWGERQPGMQFIVDDALKNARWLAGGSPEPTKDIPQFLDANNLSPAQFQQQYAGLPYRFGNDGTVTYDPAADLGKYDYAGTKSWQEMVFPTAIAALAGAGLTGLLPGTTPFWAGAPAAAAGTTAGVAGGAVPGSVNMLAATPELAGLSGGSGAVNMLAATPELAGLGSAAAPTMFGAAAMPSEMIAGLSAGGGLGVGGLGAGLEAALGPGLAAGGVSGLGSLYDILQTTTGSGLGSAPLYPTVGVPNTSGGITPPATIPNNGNNNNNGIDWSKVAGNAIPAALQTAAGVWGANTEQNAANDIYDKFFSLGKEYRDSLSNLNQDPNSFYKSDIVQGALQQGSDTLARSLSAKVGNPILNPTALQEMQNYTTRGLLDAYNNRWNQLQSAGQLGMGASAQLGANAASLAGGIPQAVGYGLGTLFGTNDNTQKLAGQIANMLKVNGLGSSAFGIGA